MKIGKTETHYCALMGRGWPSSDDEWATSAHALITMLPTDSEGSLTPMSVDDCCAAVCELCVYALGVSPEQSDIRNHVAAVCHDIEPSLFFFCVDLGTL